ncbi:hypothetical protein [Streptomyces sp. NPDC057794]|uniref:hypothetical protein n=1 Tax=Streptomyces sp. NPDC057794 TaxID=3346251 RepID=UPI0036C57CB7
MEIERRLRKGINEARKGDGLDLYLPVYERGRVPLGASFVVAETASPRGATADANSLLALMTDESDASHCETVTVAETTAVRRDALVGGKSKQDVEAASRRVDYVIPVPKDSTRCLVVSFSTVGAGDPEDEIAEATTELFDAIMTTFRWRAA